MVFKKTLLFLLAACHLIAQSLDGLDGLIKRLTGLLRPVEGAISLACGGAEVPDIFKTVALTGKGTGAFGKLDCRSVVTLQMVYSSNEIQRIRDERLIPQRFSQLQPLLVITESFSIVA